MNKHTKIFLAIILLGALSILGIKFLQPGWIERQLKNTSDAINTKGTIHIGVDNWIGYFPLCSPKMEDKLRKLGYLLRCEDDQADYASRFQKLKDGDLQFAVATIDSYLLNGAKYNYPGTITAVIDESKGGDAIVARQSVFANIDALKVSPNQTQVAFTPASPSEHLLKSISEHFGLPFTHKNSGWRVETDGSSQALEKLQSGSVDVAVLWEPDVSRALATPGLIKLIGTEDTDKLIVDILLVGRQYSAKYPEAVNSLMQSYFKTLQEYTQQPDELLKDIKASTKLDEKQINNMLNGVEWATLTENRSLWFGNDENLLDSINIAMSILINNQDLTINPLPNGDPYSITNRQFISAIRQTASYTSTTKAGRANFKKLDDNAWSHLKKVGTLQLEPIQFRQGTALMNDNSAQELNKLAKKVQRYPNFRIQVSGHTGLSGDPQENLRLSSARAQVVAQSLVDNYHLDINQIRAVGYGSSQPLKKQADESNRAYKYRLPRVEITLLTE